MACLVRVDGGNFRACPGHRSYPTTLGVSRSMFPILTLLEFLTQDFFVELFVVKLITLNFITPNSNRPIFAQKSSNRHMAVADGIRQRDHSLPVCQVDVGLGGEQKLDSLQVAELGGN